MGSCATFCDPDRTKFTDTTRNNQIYSFGHNSLIYRPLGVDTRTKRSSQCVQLFVTTVTQMTCVTVKLTVNIMCTIKVFLRKSTTNKEGKHPIKLRLYQGQKSKEISIKGTWLYEREFNAKRQRANNNKEVNLKIQRELAKYYNAITKLSSFENEFDLNDIYNFANNITPKKKAKKVNLHIIEYVLEQIVTDHENYSYGTRRHYKAFTNLLRKLNINPLLSNIDSSFLKSFEQRLIRETLMKQGTIWNKCKMMKAAVNHAFNQDYIHSPNWKRSKQLRIDKGRINFTV